ncbi:hypothetical protein M2405_004281 [Rhodococcus erythropolis]|uniref:hypothetical protein n=1 Tax=Rhodococcus erythropolis TaxID=1833 RepID=UPI0021694C07|nr:hypothetical protein [Rhodococcus erythropolis]MCS4255978.1 hypothetical protein [Rhodococcus erythropolis]MCW2425495.1 hypothetical protein [Rhodococcus erythropolis]
MVSWNVGFRLPGSKEDLSGSAATERQAIEMLVSESRKKMRQLGIRSHRGTAVFFIDSIQGDLQELNDTSLPEDYVVYLIISMVNDRRDADQKFQRERESEQGVEVSTAAEARSETVSPPPVSVSMGMINEWLSGNGSEPFAYRPVVDQLTSLSEPADINSWTSDLLDYFDFYDAGEVELFPRFLKLNLDRSMKLRAMWIKIGKNSPYIDYEELSASSGAAGDHADVFLEKFIPIADGNGETLVVDLREGSQKGCILCYPSDRAISNGVAWKGLAELLEEITRSLTEAAPFRDSYTADVVEGKLRWTPVR